MIYLLFIFLVFILLIKYNIKASFASPYLLSPDIVVLGVFLISIIVAIFNIGKWGDISIMTFFVILFSLLLFTLGSSLSIKKGHPIHKKLPNLHISDTHTIIIILFMTIVTFLDYRDVVNLVGHAGLGLMAISTLARETLYEDQEMVQHSFFVLQGIYASRAIAYIYMYIICYNKYINKEKFKFILLIPVLLYFSQIILSTGRSEFIYLIYGFLVIGYCLKKRSTNWEKKKDFKHLKYIVIGVLFFFFLFSYTSSLRSKGNTDVIETAGHYVGSSIPAFDWYIENNGLESNAVFWGEQTQILYHSIAKSLGISDYKPVYTMPPCNLKNGALTNIYTSLCRYVHDYGVLVMFIIIFLQGYIYSILFNKIKQNNSYGLRIILYSFLSYPLAEFAIDERIFSNMIGARTVYVCIYIWLFYKYLIKKDKVAVVK